MDFATISILVLALAFALAIFIEGLVKGAKKRKAEKRSWDAWMPLLLASIIGIGATTYPQEADAAVLCQSSSDPNFKAWFEGYQCPAGYFPLEYR